MRNFITAHSHPQSLDSAATPEEFLQKEIELETGHMTVTDHGSLSATRTVYKMAKEKGVTPIVGLEAYFRDDQCPILEAAGVPRNNDGTFQWCKYHHITLAFGDQAAYELAIRLLSAADLRRREDGKAEKHGQERKPIFNWGDLELLGQHNVTATTGCLVGMIQRHLLDHDSPKMALRYYEKLRALFPGKFYVEVFPHRCDRDWVKGVFVHLADGRKFKFHDKKQLRTNAGEIAAAELAEMFNRKNNPHNTLVAIKDNRTWVDLEPPVGMRLVERVEAFIDNDCRPWAPDGAVQIGANRLVMALAQRYGDPILIGDDSHFADPRQKIVQDVRLGASSAGGWRSYGSYHRMTSQEAFEFFRATMGTSLKTFEGWVDNSYAWAERFKDFKLTSEVSLPVSFYPKETLKHAFELIRQHGRMRWNDRRYRDRLEQEIKLLHRNGKIDLLPYFFIGEEVCRLYLDQGLLTGPGRGSAAGLLLTYLLGITHVDPLQYGLSLERFITLDRIQSGALPDIDQDLPHRELLVNEATGGGFLRERFGDCYAQISTISTLKLKSSVKDVARMRYGAVPDDVNEFSKAFAEPPQGVNDRDFIFGTGEWGKMGNVGSIEWDPALKEYVQHYPHDWGVVQMCLGLGRQRGRHACLPGGEPIFLACGTREKMNDCNNQMVNTGQGAQAQVRLLDQGEREVWEFELNNGQTVRCTPDHQVLTVQGWMPIVTATLMGVELIDGLQQPASMPSNAADDSSGGEVSESESVPGRARRGTSGRGRGSRSGGISRGASAASTIHMLSTTLQNASAQHASSMSIAVMTGRRGGSSR